MRSVKGLQDTYAYVLYVCSIPVDVEVHFSFLTR
jgi:hypothetical protein